MRILLRADTTQAVFYEGRADSARDSRATIADGRRGGRADTGRTIHGTYYDGADQGEG